MSMKSLLILELRNAILKYAMLASINIDDRSNGGPRRMVGKRKGRGEFCREDQWFSKETLYKVEFFF